MTTPQFSIPIIPGDQQPNYEPEPAPPPKRQRPWIVPLVAAVAALLVLMGGAAILLAFNRNQAARPAAAATAPIPRPLRLAHDACGVGQIYDGDRTLFLDLGGNKMNTGNATTVNLSCILGQLSTPQYVVVHMDQTRALDGRQTDTWGPFEASWTYHPDQGLDVLIREK